LESLHCHIVEVNETAFSPGLIESKLSAFVTEITNLMGAGQSTSHSHLPTRGLHVLRVTPSSPAFQANIEAFFDFVVGFEDDSLSSDKELDASELEKIVESHENRILNLLVWNSKSQQTRGTRCPVFIRRNTALVPIHLICTQSCPNSSLACMVRAKYRNRPTEIRFQCSAVIAWAEYETVPT
jgi:hypothetical protein